MADSKEKIKRPRSLSAEQILGHINKQPLGAKVTLLTQIRESIDTDKKILEEQLSLITTIK